MPQLLGHVLDGGMKLIGLDGRIAVPQIVDTIDALYQAIYNLPFPAAARGMQSTLSF